MGSSETGPRPASPLLPWRGPDDGRVRGFGRVREVGGPRLRLPQHLPQLLTQEGVTG